jgi:hypothetical protein
MNGLNRMSGLAGNAFVRHWQCAETEIIIYVKNSCYNDNYYLH